MPCRWRYIAFLLIPCMVAESSTTFAAPTLSPQIVHISDRTIPDCFTEQAFAAEAVPFIQRAFDRTLYSKWISLLHRAWGDDHKQPILLVFGKWIGLHLTLSLGYYKLTNEWDHRFPQWLLATLVPIGVLEAWVSWRIEQRIEKSPRMGQNPDHSLSLEIPYAAAYIVYVSLIEGAMYEWVLPGIPSAGLRTVIDLFCLSPFVMDPLAAYILHRLTRRTQDQAMIEIRHRLPFFFVFTSPFWAVVSLTVNSLSPFDPVLSYIVLSNGIVVWCTIFALSNRIHLYKFTQHYRGLRWWGRVALFFSKPLEAIYQGRFGTYLRYLGAALPAAIAVGQAWWFLGLSPLLVLVGGLILGAGILLLWDHSPGPEMPRPLRLSA